MRHRRSHRKSKDGCLVCKKRKIKCDEAKPSCANCVNFGVSCSFDHRSTSSNITSPIVPFNNESSTPTRRGRGRPRKDWTTAARERQIERPTVTASEPSLNESLPRHQTPPSPSRADHSSLNIADLELLIHFTSHTGPSLAHPDPADNSIARFWSYNVPRLGLSYHTVLHLVLGLSAYHLAYSAHTPEKNARYLTLADHHSSSGLSELTKALQSIDNSNCGALYVCAVLVSFCTFAAGPTDQDDLLVCNISNQAAHSWMSVVQGVRLIRETFEPSVLFSGLTEPLAPAHDESPAPLQPRCIEFGFPRVDWEEPVHRLRDFLGSSSDPDTAICLEAFHVVERIYEASYSKSDGSINCQARYKFVFLWLYAMDNQFVRCLQQKHPLSLLVLAYYAFLLTTLQRDWFIQSWPTHILNRIQELIDRDYLEWLRWPVEQAGLPLL
ncbi:hypothetical protein BJY04DRAFT_11765 [Aspergillus karnatakaensis]|uniref:Zn(II)2Cys6 transcription factor n=1 Tax=Aspergillus karnatakaensis TaxID=1810916 RepID=UPI003CCD43B8